MTSKGGARAGCILPRWRPTQQLPPNFRHLLQRNSISPRNRLTKYFKIFYPYSSVESLTPLMTRNNESLSGHFEFLFKFKTYWGHSLLLKTGWFSASVSDTKNIVSDTKNVVILYIWLIKEGKNCTIKDLNFWLRDAFCSKSLITNSSYGKIVLSGPWNYFLSW